MGISKINLHTNRLLIKPRIKEIEEVVKEQNILNIDQFRHLNFKNYKIWKNVSSYKNLHIKGKKFDRQF